MAGWIWHVQVDWNNDRIYESDEGGRLLSFNCGRGRESILEDPLVGYADVVLANYDGRYNSWLTTAPLYPNMRPARRVQVSVETDLGTFKLFTGQIEDIKHVAIKARGAAGPELPSVRLTVHDAWEWMQRKTVSVALAQNTDTKTAITTLLNAAGFIESSNLWILGTGLLGTTTVLGGIYGDNTDLGNLNGDAIPYWWVENESVAKNLLDLVNSASGRIQINADGKLVFRLPAEDNGAAVDYTLLDGTSGLQELLITQPRDLIRNYFSISANPRTLGTVGEAWKLNETIQIQPGQTLTFRADWRNASGSYTPAIGVVTPAAVTDYAANVNADGSGADYTSSLSVALTAYSNYADVVVTNSAGIPVFITLLRVRAQLIDSPASQKMIAQNVASQELNGRRDFELDLRWQQKSLRAQDRADWLAQFLSEPQERIECKFERSGVALTYDLGAKIADGTTNGAGGNFRIMKIRQEMDDAGGQPLYTYWTLGRVAPEDYWILGTHALGLTTKLGF